MKQLKQLVLLAVLVLAAATGVYAQEWNKEQTEVWKVVQDTWKGWKSGDAAAVSASLHDKYQGWSDDDPLPIGKASMMEWYNTMKDVMKISYYSIEPARITVLKSAAVVDYYCYFNLSWDLGDDKGSKEVKGKVVEFYAKEGDKWLLLGDMMVHGGEDDEEDDD
jgi:hypothetical protein